MPGSVFPDPGFRTRQAVSDLVAHVKPLLSPWFGAVARASGLTIVQTGEAIQLLRDDRFRFSRDETFALLDGLESLALAQGAGFEVAVVILLADLLQTRQASRPLAEGWAAAQVRLRDWPETLRAAVANGLAQGAALGLIAEAPTATDCVTRAAEVIAEPLLRMVRAMRPDELLEVADQGEDMENDLDALKAVIRHQRGIFGTDGPPVVGVENVANLPGAPGFEGCTALMLLNLLGNGDPQNWVAAHWQSLGAGYCALRASARDPVLAAVRYAYETDPMFAPEGIAIPVVHDLT